MSQPIENPDAFTPAYAYDRALDVNMAAPGDERDWKRVRAVKDLKLAFPAVTQDLQTYDDQGSPNSQKTGASGTCSFSVQRFRLGDGDPAFLPEAERIRKAADPDTTGVGATREFRVYDLRGADEAYQFRATVDWDGTSAAGVNDAAVAAVTLTTAGKPLVISNPSTEQPVPTVTAASPGTGPAGTAVTLTGTRFLGVTAVKFGASNAVFDIVSSTEIKAAVPAAGAAGAQDITVVSPAGTSTPARSFTKS